MFCVKCGSELKENEKVCSHCNYKVSDLYISEQDIKTNVIEKSESKSKNIILILLAIILTIMIFGGISYYYFIIVKPYNDALNKGNQAIAAEQYDYAIVHYTKALSYKNNEDVNFKIAITEILKESKKNYNIADKRMQDKRYLEAIDAFEKVDKQDTNRYLMAQNKIKECIKIYVTDNLKRANDCYKSNNFVEVSRYLDKIFKVDIDNIEAKKLKKSIEKQAHESVAQIETHKNDSLSDIQIISLVDKAYHAVYNMEHKNTQEKMITINDKCYRVLIPELRSEEGLFNYFNQYYTKSTSKILVNKLCKNINGEYYGICGQLGITMDILNSSVKSKKIEGTKLYATLKGKWYGTSEDFISNIVLQFEDGKWLVQYMDRFILD